MRRTTTLLFAALGMPLIGQNLENPSFENVLGEGDLSYWDHECLAESATGGAPSSGGWCARVEASNPQSCFTAWLYQVVPWAYDGMPFTLGGWCRNVPGFALPAIRVDLGIMDANGLITPLALMPAQTDTVWFWSSITDTLYLGADEQAVVLCDPGMVGGPAFALAEFDGIQFFEVLPFGVSDRTGLDLPWRYDYGTSTLHIDLGGAVLHEVQVFDARGRSLPATVSGTAHRLELQFASASPGLVVCHVRTDQGRAVMRIVKDR